MGGPNTAHFAALQAGKPLRALKSGFPQSMRRTAYERRLLCAMRVPDAATHKAIGERKARKNRRFASVDDLTADLREAD